jgi:fibronectin-binding autotransporter adhesin
MNNTHLSRAILLAAVLIPQLCTAQVTWSGAGANASWSTPENWGGVAPIDGDALVFAGNTQLVNTNDLTLLSNVWVRFDTGGFELKGNGLTLVQGITNQVGLNKLSLNLDWATNQARVYAVASGTELVIAGTNTILGGDHTYAGGGRLRLTGTHVQTPNPPATILNNIEYVVDGGSFSSGGGVRITSGTTPSASKFILTNGATMNQTLTGGAIRVGDAASIFGQLIIDHSTLTHAGGNIFVPFAASGIGVVTQNGGTNSGANIAFCNGASGNGTYNMVGGTLEALQIRKVNTTTTTAAMSFDGSTLRPVATTTLGGTFFTGLTTAEIKSGGLTLDNNGVDLTIGQVFTGAGCWTKTGAGTLTIGTGNSAYTGGFTLNAGTVSLTANNGFGTGTLTINGGTLQPSATTTRSATNAVVIGGDYSAAGNANLTFSGPITLTGNRTITATTTHVLSGSVGESGGAWGITKMGSGVLQLTGSANSYSGATVVSNGVIQVNATSRLGNEAGELKLAGGTFRTSADRVVSTAPIGNPLTLVDSSTIETTSAAATANLNFTSSAITTTAGTLTLRNSSAGTGTFACRFTGGGFNFSSPIVLADYGTNFVQLTLFNSNNVSPQTFSAEISGTGSLLRGNTTGGFGGQTLLTAANSFTGGTVLNDGSIGIGDDHALSTGTVTANGGGLFTYGAPRLVSNPLTVTSSLVIGGDLNLEFAGPISLDGGNRVFTVNNSAATTLSGAIASTVAAGATAWTKAGASTLTIPVANTYAGDTAVTAGTLKVTNPSGSATGSGSVAVTSSGVLAGNGHVAGVAVSAGGKVAPGTGVGTLTATSATFGAGGVYQVEMGDADTNLLAGAGWDFLNISGPLAITATAATPFVIELSSLGGLAAHFDNTQSYSWVIASAAGGITGFAPDAFVVATNGFQNNLGSSVFSVAVQGNNLVLKFGSNVVPQPTIYPLTGAGTTNTALSWSSVSGASYTVQYKTNLSQVGWLNLTNVTGTGATTTILDNTSPVPAERYYRIISP